MKIELVSILACPVCKGELKLSVAKEEGGEMISGALYCNRCEVNYPVADAIPNLLPPEKSG